MQIYNYTAKDQHNLTVKGKVEARDERHAAQILRSRKMVVISLKSIAEGSGLVFLDKFINRIKTDDVVSVTQQLSTMLNSGLPLTDAIDLLRVQSKPAMAKILNEVLRDIQGGTSLADALARHEKVFSKVYTALVRAGEAAGKLDVVLQRLAQNVEKTRDFQAKTKGALVYPVIVTIAMVLVVSVMMIVVVPQLTTMYESFGAELPFITKVLVTISDIFRKGWLIVAVALGAVFFMMAQWRKTESGSKRIDQMLLNIPIFGELRQKIMLTEFALTLSLLVGAGISILEALDIVSQSVDNAVYRDAMKKVAKGVEKGMPLASMLARQKIFPSLLAQMVSVGEETGELDSVLEKVAHYFEQEAEHKIKNLTTALEPLIMMVLGAIVGFIVLAIITPLYQLTELF